MAGNPAFMIACIALAGFGAWCVFATCLKREFGRHAPGEEPQAAEKGKIAKCAKASVDAFGEMCDILWILAFAAMIIAACAMIPLMSASILSGNGWEGFGFEGTGALEWIACGAGAITGCAAIAWAVARKGNVPHIDVTRR